MITKQPNDYVKIANQQLIKQNNLTLVFNLINRYEPISRVKLARLTRLSPTTISSLVEELLENELVMEIGAGKTNSSGRKPIMLKVNQKSRFVISLEVKKDKISGGVYDLKCNEIARKSISEYDIAELGNGLISLCEELIEESKLNRNNFLGIALGIPGIINYRDYTVVSSTVIEKLHTNKTFYTELSNRFSNIPILMENESCFAAYAEHTIARSGREGDNILIDINEGVGCGIIIDDNIYKGAWGIAGELGHMTIDMNGEHCECGNRGCLETLVSIPAILKRALKAAEEKKSGVFWELVQKKDLPLFDSFLKAYEDKDPVALETGLLFYCTSFFRCPYRLKSPSPFVRACRFFQGRIRPIGLKYGPLRYIFLSNPFRTKPMPSWFYDKHKNPIRRYFLRYTVSHRNPVGPIRP